MISVVIGAILAALFAGLLIVRARYGALRLSELPALLWCLLAGPDHQRQLRGVLSRRGRRKVSVTADEVGIRIAVRQVPGIDPQVAELHAMMDDLAERVTVRLRPCIGCGSSEARVGGKCLDCYGRAKRGHDDRRPDATVSATVDQYAAWLRGYIKRGGKPTHFYDYPFSRAGFRYASTRLTIDSGYEFGARSRMIVVASGVETQRTNPHTSFRGWGHTKVFFMHGYRTNDSIVPVYSDPEFDFAR